MASLSYISIDGTLYEFTDASAVPSSRTVNNKSLESNITLTYSDVGVTIMTTSEIDDVIDS